MKNKNGPFEHQEVKGLRALENMEDVQQEQHLTGTSVELQESQKAIVQPNPLTMHIQTPMKDDKVSNRPLAEVIDMEVDGQSSSKRTKIVSQGKYIIDLEESINKNGQVGPVIIENQVE